MEDLFFKSVKDFRYERKFYVDDLRKDDVSSLIKFHPALFREIYYERVVNNIYLDTLDLVNYFDNLNGVSKRVKARVRWYGKTFSYVEKPVLELKLKHNLHIGKISLDLKPMDITTGLSISSIRDILRASALPESVYAYVMRLDLCMLNSYTRKYYLSADGKYRLTVDTDLTNYKLFPNRNDFLCKSEPFGGIVIEIKYNKPNDERVDEITNLFPFRMTRGSKYAIGVSELYA